MENFTEEELRSKVIYPYLKNLGFNEEQIHLERSYKIYIGKGKFERIDDSKNNIYKYKTVRSDVLVRDKINNKNLFLFELKKPDHILTEDDRIQALSYARLLEHIPPFTIITNGKDTEIYDSVTKEKLNNKYIDKEHPYVRNGFKVQNLDIQYYYDALQELISLSSENLLSFCKNQVSLSMELLKSDDIFSGKKYIPSLYVSRVEQEERLKKLLDNNSNKLILVTGSPQHGKTSFVCHMVEELLSLGKPCIFYPAKNIRNSLLNTLKDDFEWIVNESSNSNSVLINKLQKILRKTNNQLYVFIDGLNEGNDEFIEYLNVEYQQLRDFNIKFIISFTDITASKLFFDKGGDPTILASSFLSTKQIKNLEVDSKGIDERIITIPPYNNEESIYAFLKYKEKYSVSARNEIQIKDPFLLRIIMNKYSNKSFDGNIDEIDLISNYIYQKIIRTRKDNNQTSIILAEIANKIFINDSPIKLSKVENISDINLLCESALITSHIKNNMSFIDFYNEREQSYLISIQERDWINKVSNIDLFNKESIKALNTKAGTIALIWFFKANPKITEKYSLNFFEGTNYLLQSTILHSIRLHLNDNKYFDNEWIIKLIKKSISSISEKVKVEAFKLIPYMVNFYYDMSELLFEEDIELFIKTIFENDEYENTYDRIIYKTLSELHKDEYVGYYYDSRITSILKSIFIKDNSVNALIGLAHCSAFNFLNFIDKNNIEKELIANIKNLDYILQNDISDYFYGGDWGCPAFIDNASICELIEEFKFSTYYEKKFSTYYSNPGVLKLFKDLSFEIKNKIPKKDFEKAFPKRKQRKRRVDIKQTKINFDD